jgi:hypothetical protein
VIFKTLVITKQLPVDDQNSEHAARTDSRSFEAQFSDSVSIHRNTTPSDRCNPTDATRPIQPGGGTPGTPEHAQTFRAEKPE